ncbi:MAG: putative signal peptide-containing protein [Acidimicrobiales bacterium]|nr:putative signal peptide-containing protein [Acidimicrobiales bacterium]
MTRREKHTGDRVGWPAVVALALLVASCSSGGSGGANPASTATTAAAGAQSTGSAATTAAPAVRRPPGPSADLSHELSGGKGAFVASGDPAAERPPGYVQHEYVAAGTAKGYRAQGTQGSDGRWTFQPSTTAPYRTRIVVRRPADPSRFSGTVVVEWLNVSGGLDADAEWSSIHEEVVRSGHVWVGVSAQQIGVIGGPVLVEAPGGKGIAGVGLRKLDPARYGSLTHPGDGYSFDIFTQVARALRLGGTPLGGATPGRILAAGESQSAFALTTYADGVQPLTHAFDGFLIHSRGSSGLPLVAPGKSADISGALSAATAAIFRTDLDVPVLDVQSESDLLPPLRSLPARQPDTPRFRLWEVAGTSHADVHTLGPAGIKAIQCGVPINDGPLHLVVKAALHDLDAWVRTGAAPPIAPRISVTTGAQPAIGRTPDGLAVGGIRTPQVDVPVAALTGVAGPNPSVLCLLLGSTKPFTPARIAALYPSRAAYTKAYDADAERTIRSGFVLAADKPALLAYARPAAVA